VKSGSAWTACGVTGQTGVNVPNVGIKGTAIAASGRCQMFAVRSAPQRQRKKSGSVRAIVSRQSSAHGLTGLLTEDAVGSVGPLRICGSASLQSSKKNPQTSCLKARLPWFVVVLSFSKLHVNLSAALLQSPQSTVYSELGVLGLHLLARNCVSAHV